MGSEVAPSSCKDSYFHLDFVVSLIGYLSSCLIPSSNSKDLRKNINLSFQQFIWKFLSAFL